MTSLRIIMDTHNWIDLFVMIVCLCIVNNNCFVHSSNEWEKVVNAARCRVRCLSNLPPPSDIQILRNRPKQTNAFTWCIEDSECKECLKPCSQPYVNLPLCQRICEPSDPSSSSCAGSCEFLHQIYTTHPGSCPPRDELTGPERACIDECESDTDCSSYTKCCSNSCGRTCQGSWSPFQGMPSIPGKPLIREKAKGGSIDLKWDIPHQEMREPVLFIIEQRWNVGHEHSELQMTSWQQIAQTTGTTVSIKEMTPGYWYQYRASAVNQHGSRGVSDPTDPYRLSREPDAPGAPRNLTEGDTIIKNNKIGVIIKWLPPKKSDLPVSRYKIFWSKKVSGVVPADGENRHVIDGEELQFIIPDLNPDTTYFVQVQAISQYGDQRLKSDRASLYIVTYPLPQKLQKDISDVEIRPLPKPGPVDALAVHEPFFQNGLIKANVTWELPTPEFSSGDHNSDDEDISDGRFDEDDLEADEPPQQARVHRVLVSWQPEVCIADVLDNGLSQTFSISTQENFFVIYDLRFDCHYNVKVQTVSPDGVTGPVRHVSFPTPTCQGIQVRGATKPDCPTNDPRTPETPINLEYSIVINKNNITARLSWQEPMSDSPITGYRIVWGQALITERMQPVLDGTTAYTKVLPKGDNLASYSIISLREATTYVAEVQALSRAGDGTIAKVNFNTPILSLKPIDTPYNRVTEKDNHHRWATQARQNNKPYYNYPTPSLMESTNHLEYSSLNHSQKTKINCVLLSLCLILTIVRYETIQRIFYWINR